MLDKLFKKNTILYNILKYCSVKNLVSLNQTCSRLNDVLHHLAYIAKLCYCKDAYEIAHTDFDTKLMKKNLPLFLHHCAGDFNLNTMILIRRYLPNKSFDNFPIDLVVLSDVYLSTELSNTVIKYIKKCIKSDYADEIKILSFHAVNASHVELCNYLAKWIPNIIDYICNIDNQDLILIMLKHYDISVVLSKIYRYDSKKCLLRLPKKYNCTAFDYLGIIAEFDSIECLKIAFGNVRFDRHRYDFCLTLLKHCCQHNSYVCTLFCLDKYKVNFAEYTEQIYRSNSYMTLKAFHESGYDIKSVCEIRGYNRNWHLCYMFYADKYNIIMTDKIIKDLIEIANLDDFKKLFANPQIDGDTNWVIHAWTRTNLMNRHHIAAWLYERYAKAISDFTDAQMRSIELFVKSKLYW